MDGIINIYKEKGYTSHDVVARLRGILKQKKIGHTGTLDPEAEGVLPVCLGRATKLCGLLTDKDKIYETVLKLGIKTDTQDMSGRVINRQEVRLDEEAIRTVISSFVGGYEQVPPMYSARKINGKKLYELAREGKEVERRPQKVMIYDIRILNLDSRQNEVRMQVFCSKGTYIRTLCHDIGEKLMCGGTMKDLLRTRVDRFWVEDSLTLQRVEALFLQKDGLIFPKEQDKQAVRHHLEDYMVSIEDMFPEYRSFYVHEDQERFLYNGNQLALTAGTMMETNPESDQVKIYDAKGDFKALYQMEESRRYLKPVKMFL